MNTKTFDDIMYNINNLDADNYENTIKYIDNFEDEEQKKQLCDFFVKKLKNGIISHEDYLDEETLKNEVETIKDEITTNYPSFQQAFIDNEFNLEAIKNAREEKNINPIIQPPSEITNQVSENEETKPQETEEIEVPESEETKTQENEISEIAKIETRIKELQLKNINLFRKNILLIDLNEELENRESLIKNIRINLEDDPENFKSEDSEYAKILEETLDDLKEAIKNIEENYDNLSSAELKEITHKNGVNSYQLKERIKDAIRNTNIINYDLIKLDRKINDLTNEIQLKKADIANLESEENYNKMSKEELEEILNDLNKKQQELWPSEEESVSNKLNIENSANQSADILFEVNEISNKKELVEMELMELEKINHQNQKEEIYNNIKSELEELQKLKYIKNTYYQIVEDADNDLKINYAKENVNEKINEFIDNHRRVSQINKYENNDKLKKELLSEIKSNLKPQKISEIIKDEKLWLKALAGTAGFVAGLGMSCVPGVGTIRMGISATKLVGNAVNIWAKNHPNGKIAKVKNNINDKLNSKFPRIMSTANKMREKLKETPLNCLVNGIAAGYITGNIIESLTGETVYEHIKDIFDDDYEEAIGLIPETVVPEQTPDIEIEGPEQTPDIEIEGPDNHPIVDDPSINEPIKPETMPGIEDTPSFDEIPDITEAYIPKPGEVIDLSALEQGFSNGYSNTPINLMNSLGKEVVFDKAVELPDGRIMWHFKQLNGAGYAWFESEVVQELLSKTTEVVSKTM